MKDLKEVELIPDVQDLVITPDKQVRWYVAFSRFESNVAKWIGRLEVTVKNIRGNVCQAIYVSVFSNKDENDCKVKMHEVISGMKLPVRQ